MDSVGGMPAEVAGGPARPFLAARSASRARDLLRRGTRLRGRQNGFDPDAFVHELTDA